MDYLNHFMREYQAGRVELTLQEKNYKKRLKGLYPRKLVAADILLHAAWIGVALAFAYRISETGPQATATASLGGMLVAIVIGRFIPLGFVFGGIILGIGVFTLPFYLEAGPVGIFGLSSVSKIFRIRNGKKLVKKWALGSEEQFLQAVAEEIVAVTPTAHANEDTSLFLSQLEEATTRETTDSDQPDQGAGPGRSAEFPQTQVDFTAAEQFYRESLANAERNFGPDHPDVASSLNNLAVLYRNHGDYAAAEPLSKRSLAIREKHFGPDHPDVATSLNNLAVLYASQSDYVEAEPLYKRSLNIREKILGPNHPDVANSLKNLAALYRATDREEKAAELERRAESITGARH